MMHKISSGMNEAHSIGGRAHLIGGRTIKEPEKNKKVNNSLESWLYSFSFKGSKLILVQLEAAK